MIQIPPVKYKQLPIELEWMLYERAPMEYLEAIKHYGILEHPGPGSNPNIMKWVDELGIRVIVSSDSVPWCGVLPAICCKRTGWAVPEHPYRAKSWLTWGNAVTEPMWWDKLIFARPGGGHVGYYVGEDTDSYLVYGANQSNMVNTTWIAKDRLIGARRAQWRIGQPANIRKIFLKRTGALSTNEA